MAAITNPLNPVRTGGRYAARGGQPRRLDIKAVRNELLGVSAVMICLSGPSMLYLTGVSHITKANNNRVAMERQITLKRTQIQVLEDELEGLRQPERIAAWAAEHGMAPAASVYVVGASSRMAGSGR